MYMYLIYSYSEHNYLFFGTQGDQKSSLRSPITSKLVANMIQKSGAEHIMMLDPHSPQLVGFFDIPVDALKVYNC